MNSRLADTFSARVAGNMVVDLAKSMTGCLLERDVCYGVSGLVRYIVRCIFFHMQNEMD